MDPFSLAPLQCCRLAICPNYIAASKLTRRLTGSLAAEEKLRLINNLLILCNDGRIELDLL